MHNDYSKRDTNGKTQKQAPRPTATRFTVLCSAGNFPKEGLNGCAVGSQVQLLTQQSGLFSTQAKRIQQSVTRNAIAKSIRAGNVRDGHTSVSAGLGRQNHSRPAPLGNDWL